MRTEWSRSAHHNFPKARLNLPARYRHPGTGVMVEVDTTGLICFTGNNHGIFRQYNDMRDSGLKIWTAADEVGILTRHGWKRI